MNKEKAFYLVLGIIVLAVIVYVFIFICMPKRTKSQPIAEPKLAEASKDLSRPEKSPQSKVERKQGSLQGDIYGELKRLKVQITELDKKVKNLEEKLVQVDIDITGYKDGKRYSWEWSVAGKIDANLQRIQHIENVLNITPTVDGKEVW